MADERSLLSFIARGHTVGREDVATNALYFILSRSNSAKRALSEFLGDDRGPLQVAAARPWGADALGAIPDLACFDEADNLIALIESKFWASLTHHQPVTYWEKLPVDRPAVLLFLAPDYRIDSGSLWEQLVDRLHIAGHELGPADRRESLLTASAKIGQQRLILTTWNVLLEKMALKAKDDGDVQACFEIAELQGLATDVTASENPRRDENLKKLIADAVKRVEQAGWANTDGLTVGQGYEYYGRYLRLAGASAWVGVDFNTLKQFPAKSLWVRFYADPDAQMSLESVQKVLGDSAEPGSGWLKGWACVPMGLPTGADRDAVVKAIVAELERIAKLIDPDGPTYSEGR